MAEDGQDHVDEPKGGRSGFSVLKPDVKVRLKRRWEIIKSYIGWEDYIAGSLILLGVFGYFEGPIPFIPHLTNFYMDIRSELIGIGITVLIIDNVNEMYRRREEKRRLILQMGSPDNAFAVEAVRQLSTRGWHTDGSLSKADLNGANLSGARLIEADLSGARLFKANLSGAFLVFAKLVDAELFMANLSGADLYVARLIEADLRGANLSGANLSEANLSRAKLKMANLSGADLSRANLSGANVTLEQLAQAILDENTTMPDGTKYKPPQGSP